MKEEVAAVVFLFWPGLVDGRGGAVFEFFVVLLIFGGSGLLGGTLLEAEYGFGRSGGCFLLRSSLLEVEGEGVFATDPVFLLESSGACFLVSSSLLAVEGEGFLAESLGDSIFLVLVPTLLPEDDTAAADCFFCRTMASSETAAMLPPREASPFSLGPLLVDAVVAWLPAECVRVCCEDGRLRLESVCCARGGR